VQQLQDTPRLITSPPTGDSWGSWRKGTCMGMRVGMMVGRLQPTWSITETPNVS